MITTNTGAKKLESSDNWREIFPDNQGAQGAHNASVGAHDAAICQTCQTINGTTNNSGHTINSGEYFIANGGKYKATASIPNGEPWASSAEPVTDNDLIGALNSKLQNQNLTSGIVPTAIGANANLSLIKTGNVAVLDVVNLILPSNITTDTLIAQLPVTPAIQTFAAFESLAGKSIFAFVSAEGLKISGITGANANDNIYGSIVFVTAES